MQHPNEAAHPKNTARLLSLGLKNCKIYIGENPLDFDEIASIAKNQPEQFWVLFPNSHSRPIESVSIQSKTLLPKNLILLDGTWRKAKKMWILNPWLHDLPSWHFAQPPANQYRMRKTNLELSLSTLEAAAYCLDKLCNYDSTKLYKLLEAMQSQIERFQTDKTKD